MYALRSTKRAASSPALVLTGTLLFGVSSSGLAVDLNFGDESEVSGTVDITLGVGAQWRAQDYDTKDADAAVALGISQDLRVPENGDLISQVARATFEAGVDWRNYGLVLSGTTHYDTEIMDRDRDRGLLRSGPYAAPVEWSDAAEDDNGNPQTLLDAYLYGSFDVGENANPLEVRAGKQVINWGEGLYFIDGVATQVALDFNAFSTPGAELKEAYIATEALYANLGVGDNSSLEAYYQWKFRPHKLGAQGTIWGDDALAEGNAETGGDFHYLVCATVSCDFPIRGDREDTSDDGQFGLAFRTGVGDGEFGVYYSRYHEKTPFAIGAEGLAYGTDGILSLEGPGANLLGLNTFYPEELDMLGLSYSSTLGAWSFNAEVAYRPDRPLWTDPTGGVEEFGGTFGFPNVSNYMGQPGAEAAEEHDTAHASVHGIWLGNTIDAVGVDSQVVLVQLGVDYVDGDTDNLAAHGSLTNPQWYHLASNETGGLAPDGYRGGTQEVDNTAWGLAANWIGTWNQALPNTDLTLDLFLQYDFSGNSHFWGNFAEDRLLGAVGLTAAIDQNAEVGLTYSFTDQKESHLETQDLLSLSASYKF